MLRHLAVFTWKPDTTPAQLQAVRDGLAELPDRIPEIRAYAFGDDAGLADGNAQFAVVADFDDEIAWRSYIDHPAHQAVLVERIRPITATRTAAQFLVKG